MHMRWHDDRAAKCQAGSFKIQQTFPHFFTHIRTRQRARTHARVQPFVEPFSKTFVVFRQRGFVPRLGMFFKPQRIFRPPCVEFTFRDGIREPKRHPIRRMVRNPVRQVSLRRGDVEQFDVTDVVQKCSCSITDDFYRGAVKTRLCYVIIYFESNCPL